MERSTRALFTGVIPETGIHGIPRERQYDAVVTADAPDVAEGSTVRFVGLEDGSLVIEEGDGDLTRSPRRSSRRSRRPTAPPQCGAARRQWAVAAQGLRVVELPEPGGDEVELVIRGDEQHAGRRREPFVRNDAGAGAARRRRCGHPRSPPGRHALGGSCRSALGGASYPRFLMASAARLLEKVLRVGEGRRMKRLAEQAAYITSIEPEFHGALRRRAPGQDGRVPAAARERRDARGAALRGVRGRHVRRACGTPTSACSTSS